jgi:hypothetical protein
MVTHWANASVGVGRHYAQTKPPQPWDHFRRAGGSVNEKTPMTPAPQRKYYLLLVSSQESEKISSLNSYLPRPLEHEFKAASRSVCFRD